jgi:hypothetical protein
MYVNVKGGTNAGSRRLKPKPFGWLCNCPEFTVHKGYLVRCPDCGLRRDDAKVVSIVQDDPPSAA